MNLEPFADDVTEELLESFNSLALFEQYEPLPESSEAPVSDEIENLYLLPTNP